MNRLKSLTLAGLCLLAANFSSAQKLEAEANIEVSNKAKRGYLGNVVVDDARQQIDLVFVTKSKPKYVKFEAYQFDYDLNLINQFDDEQETDKAKTKYKWFNFKGEKYTVQGITAEANLVGNFVLKKKEVTYGFNWWTGRYGKTTKLLDKVKYTDENGRKMFFISSFDNDVTGELCALAGIKGGMKDPIAHFKKMQLMKVNTDLKIVEETTIDFVYPYQVVYSGGNDAVDPESDEQSDWYVVLAPMGGQGIPNKEANPNPQDLILLQVSADGKIVQKTNFNSKLVTWQINGVYEVNGEVFIYGPGDAKGIGKKTANPIINPDAKFPLFQLAKIKNNKVDFVSTTNLADFKIKATGAPDDKKPPVYNGKKVRIAGLNVHPSGEVFIAAQDYGTNKDGWKLYKDIFMFHFSKEGNLRASYGIRHDVKKGGLIGGGLADPRYHSFKGDLIENENGLFWLLELPYVTVTETENLGFGKYATYYLPKRYPKMVKIDLANAKIAGIADYGEKKHFLIDEHPMKTINGGKEIIFLGESLNGKHIWLGKLNPATIK